MAKKRILAFVLCLLMIVSSSVCVMADDTATPSGQIKNIIYLIPDGGAMAPFNLAAEVKKAGGFDSSVYPYATPVEQGDMYLRQYLVGAETTYSANDAVTDSAAAGTALSSGYKTNNAYIGVDPQGKPHANILEASQSVGKNVGMVSTYEWMHATPASFSAHELNRNNYPPMSEQIVNQGIDVVLGAGFGAAQWGSIAEAEKRGYDIVDTRAELEAIQPGDKVWGNLVSGNFMWDIERPESVPNLAEMTTAAIRALDDPENENGFFLMVEGSKVDGGGHDNKAREMVSEYLAFDKACEVAIEYAKTRNDTLVVVLPDHDTGGLIVNDLETTVEKIRKGIQPENGVDVSWETGGNHSARNGGVFMYVPEGVAYPKGLNNTSADPFNENIINNIDIAPYLADLIGVDLDELTDELFVDVSDVGYYDSETEIFSFNDYDFSIKRNESRAYYGDEEISLDGQVSLYLDGHFYVPQLLLDTIEDLEGEFNNTEVFKAASANTTTTENSFAEAQEGEYTALTGITKGTKLTYGPYALGRASALGLDLRMNIPGGTPEDYTVTAYLVDGDTETELGTYDASMFVANSYHNYFLPFNRTVTGDVTIALEFGKDYAGDVSVGLSSVAFANASIRVNAFAETYRSSRQFYGPSVTDASVSNNAAYATFGDGDGDYMIMPNVYFGSKEAKGILLRLDPPSEAERGEASKNAKIEIRLDGPTGELVGELDYDELNYLANKYIYVPCVLDKPLTGAHNICIKFVDYRSQFGSFRFLTSKDGTSSIYANTFDVLEGDVGIRDSGSVSHFGQSNGEKLTFSLVDFGDVTVKAMDFNFSAWGGDGDKVAGTDSHIEMYVDSIAEENLIGTISYDELSQHQNKVYAYTILLEEGLTGMHDICFVSSWQGEFVSFKFLPAKDGTKRILAVNYDDAQPDTGIMSRADGEYDIVGWFGNISSDTGKGEELNYKLVDFGENMVNKAVIRFRPWNDAKDVSKDGDGKVELYADGVLVGTIPFEELNGTIDKWKDFTINLATPLTGIHDFKIVSYWQGGLSWFEFGVDAPYGVVAYGASADQTTGDVSLTVAGTASGTDTVKVLFVSYDEEGRFLDIAEAQSLKAADITEDGVKCEASFGKAIPDGATVKAYVWNSIEAMTTLTPSVDFAI